VEPGATATEIKAAYHRTLLSHHPDKTRAGPVKQAQSAEEIAVDDFAELRRAFETLSDEGAKAAYNVQLGDEVRQQGGKQRPAQVVSLDEFEECDGVWRFGCRCGRDYVVKEKELEQGVHLIGCEGCSEVVYVGYEDEEEIAS